MTRKELKSKLLRNICNRLVKYGFEQKVYGQSFKKKIKDGVAKIHLSFIDHVDDFDVTVDVAIRFDNLEELINHNNKLLTKREKKETCTIGVEMGNLIEGEQKRWTIVDDSDIEPVSQSIFNIIEKVTIPYIQQYSDMETVFHLTVKDDSIATLNCPIDYVRAMSAVGLAKILGKTEMMEEIIEQKTKYLEEKDDFGLPWFKEFVEYVKTI